MERRCRTARRSILPQAMCHAPEALRPGLALWFVPVRAKHSQRHQRSRPTQPAAAEHLRLTYPAFCQGEVLGSVASVAQRRQSVCYPRLRATTTVGGTGRSAAAALTMPAQ